jgi:peptide/nickel transport system substrate-binding protein
MENDFSRRRFLQYATYAGGALALTSCTGGGSEQSGAATRLGSTLPPLEGAQVVLDPAQFPKSFKESPEFAKQVAAGKLPPVAQRIGQDPLVLKPAHEIGHYGGEIRRGYLDVGDNLAGALFCAGPDSLTYVDHTNKQVVPNLARDFQLSDNDKVLTIHLRRGMKWSDGKPFTADDIVFWREDINLNGSLGGSGTAALKAGGKDIVVKKVDDFTVQYISTVRNSLLPSVLYSSQDLAGMAGGGKLLLGGYAPKHYLSQFHPKYTSESQANKLAKAAGFDDWTAYFTNRMSWEVNPQLPALTPWIVTRPISSPPWEITANPYSIWVDTEGNQLPYIPKVTLSNAGNIEVVNLRMVAGQLDVQDRSLTVANLPVLIKNQKRGNYTVHRAPSSKMDFGIRINLAYTKDKTLGDLLRDVDFRRALSLGIDRDQVNQAFALGTSIPSATMVADDNKYFPGPEWRRKWATLDLKQANALLDKIGLTKRDSGGYRLRPDGKGRITLDYQTISVFADFLAMGEMIKKQWQKIGIDMTVQNTAVNLLLQRSLANEMMIAGHGVGTDDPFLSPDTFLPTNIGGFPGLIGIPYAKWFASDGKSGVEPPKEMDLLKEAMRLYRQGLQSTEAKRIEIGKQLFKMHADQVWSIGVIGFGLIFYGIYCTNNKLGNVPGRIINSSEMETPSNSFPMTYYYK